VEKFYFQDAAVSLSLCLFFAWNTNGILESEQTSFDHRSTMSRKDNTDDILSHSVNFGLPTSTPFPMGGT
jgi:hypothetical protein